MALKEQELTKTTIRLIIADSNYRTEEDVLDAVYNEDIFVYATREDYLADGFEFDSRSYYGALENGVVVRYVHG